MKCLLYARQGNDKQDTLLAAGLTSQPYNTRSVSGQEEERSSEVQAGETKREEDRGRVYYISKGEVQPQPGS